MSKLLLLAVLVFTALACDSGDEPTVAGDASPDSLPFVRPDGGADSLPGTRLDTGRSDSLVVKSDLGGSVATSCPATIQGVLVTKGVTYTVLPTTMVATVSCADPGYARIIPPGVTCEQLLQGYRTVDGDACCIAYGNNVPDFTPYCGRTSNIGKLALCSADGKFIGWNCS
jgi:hypothetical protein